MINEIIYIIFNVSNLSKNVQYIDMLHFVYVCTLHCADVKLALAHQPAGVGDLFWLVWKQMKVFSDREFYADSESGVKSRYHV